MADRESQLSPLSPMCSPLTSDGGTPRSSAGGDPTEEDTARRLSELLSRPREAGGYSGRVSFTEFQALARPLHWTQEDVEDCWYDILRGVPAAEAADMPRVAELVCGYCLASPYPLPESGLAGLLLPPSLGTSPGKSSRQAAVDRSDVAVQTSTPPPQQHPDGIVDSPKRRALSPTASSSASSVAPPPKPQSYPRAVRSSIVSPRRERRRQNPSMLSLSSVVQRFAAPTESSRRKTGISGGGSSVLPSPVRRRPASATTSAVFDRLSAVVAVVPADGATTAATSTTAAVPSQADRERLELAECTFRPAITPFRSERLDRLRGGRPDCYKRPTAAYLSRLTGEERHGDPVEDAPATPRVPSRPAPGPSPHVPPGYVEGVVRLRLGMVCRAGSPSSREFSSGLRGSYGNSGGNPTIRELEAAEQRRLLDAAMTPILRLPLKSSSARCRHGGNYDNDDDSDSADNLVCVDVRLATSLRHRSCNGSSGVGGGGGIGSAPRHGLFSGSRGATSPSPSSRASLSPVRGRRSGPPSPRSCASRVLPSRFKEHPDSYYYRH